MIPNTCQVPNVILDKIMPQVSHAEFKVVMAIVRKTYGWGKESDRIALSQLMKLTGVSRRNVIYAVRHLDWLIFAHKTGGGLTEYSLNIDVDTGHLSKGGATIAPVASATIAPTKPILLKPKRKPKKKKIRRGSKAATFETFTHKADKFYLEGVVDAVDSRKP